MLAADEQLGVIAAAVGISRNTVRSRRDELGIEAQATRLTPEQVARILAAASGATMGAADDLPGHIADSLDLDRNRVRRILISRGVISREEYHAPLDQDTLDRIAGFIDDGAPYAEIARTLGISEETVARHFPGQGRSSEHRSLIAWVAHQNRRTQELHREFYRAT